MVSRGVGSRMERCSPFRRLLLTANIFATLATGLQFQLRSYNATTTAVGLPYACVEIEEGTPSFPGNRAETPEDCAKNCVSQGEIYPYFTMQKDDCVCYATVEIGKIVNPAQCSNKCAGDPKKKCGGEGKLASLYSGLPCSSL
ncbi:unnamed protein product [Amoebophrya sp. A120]|nr:unnamed protein product [Amoebophrya sp. A120]|eukprot:GSA120T00007604001.1